MKLEWKTCLKVGGSIFLLYLCIHYWSKVAGLISALLGAAAPLLIGCVIAYMINILMSLYERHYFPNSSKTIAVKSRRPVCLLGAVITMLAVIALIICLVIPQLVSCVQLILAELPDAMKALVAWLERWKILPENIADFLNAIDWKSKLGQIISVLTSGIGNVMGVVVSAVSSVFSGIVTAFIAIIFSFYLLMSKDKLLTQGNRLMKHYLKETWYAKVSRVLGILNNCFRRYIIGQCTEAVILGVLCMLGMLILRLPYAVMIGALVAFTALIPVAGAYIGAIVGAFMILTVSPVKALIFIIYLVILQQLEGNLIYPRVVGSSMGLPGIWVLAAVTIGGGMMGILGMLLGVPLAAAIYRILRESINPPAVTSECETVEETSQPPENPNA